MENFMQQPACPGPCEDDGVREFEVCDQLDRILSSGEFSASAQISAFLKFVVQEHLAGRADRIKERTIAIQVLKRGKKFDGRIDTSVRNVACKLRRALDRYYAIEGTSDHIRIDVPKGGYRPVIARAGNNVSLATQGSGDSDSWESRTTKLPGRSLDQCGVPVLAVLPFAPFDNSGISRFLAESLPLDLSVRLANGPMLSVVDYMVTRHLLGKKFDPRDIGSHLHADYLLMGSVRSYGRRVRVTVQLTHSGSGLQLWASFMDGTVEGTSFLEEVVTRIVAAIGDIYGVVADVLGRDCRVKKLAELSSLEAVIRHFQFQCQFVPQDCPAVIEIINRAVQTNPQFSWGWSALAHLHLQSFACLMDVPDVSDRASSYIHRALAIDPTDAYANWVQGLYYTFHGMPVEMARAMERTVELSDSVPFLLGAAGVLLCSTADHQRGLDLLLRAMRLNPRQPGWFHWGPFLSQYRLEQYDEAMATTKRFSLPDTPWDALFRSAALAQNGHTDEARLELHRSGKTQPAFAHRSRDGLQRLLIDPQLRDHMLDGLRLAGLPAN